MSDFTCKDCKNLNENQRDGYKYHCDALDLWVDPDEAACRSRFREDPYRTDNEKYSLSNGSGGGCFFTVATMFGLKEKFRDDGYHLSSMRKARDICKASGCFVEDIEQYYKISPLIVSKINSQKDKKEIYLGIFKRLVEPFVALIENGQYEDAHALFCNVRDELIVKYCPESA